MLSNLLSLNSELSKNNHSLEKKLLNFGGPESDSQNNIKNNDAINISNNEIQLGMGFDR